MGRVHQGEDTGWVHQVGTPGGYIRWVHQVCASGAHRSQYCPVYPGAQAVQRYPPPPRLSQVLENLQEQQAARGRPLLSPPRAHSPQHSLVLWVQQRAGAGLAVLRCASSGIPIEARCTLVAEIPRRVVQAALWGTRQQGDGAGRRPRNPAAPCAASSPPNSRSRGRSRDGSCRSGRCTRTARSAPSTGRPRCACSQAHSPAGRGRPVSAVAAHKALGRQTSRHGSPGRTGPGSPAGTGTPQPLVPVAGRAGEVLPRPC